MNLEFQKAEYRRLDVMWGQLTTMLKVENELLQLRKSQLVLNRAKLEGSVAIIVSVLVGAVPALLAILPNEYSFWPWSLAGLSLLYLILLSLRLRDASAELKQLTKMLSPVRIQRLEDQPEFILTRVSGIGSRLSVAREVLKFCTKDGIVKKCYQDIEKHWISQLQQIGDQSQELFTQKIYTQEVHEMILDWIKSAIERGEEQE